MEKTEIPNNLFLQTFLIIYQLLFTLFSQGYLFFHIFDDMTEIVNFTAHFFLVFLKTPDLILSMLLYLSNLIVIVERRFEFDFHFLVDSQNIMFFCLQLSQFDKIVMILLLNVEYFIFEVMEYIHLNTILLRLFFQHQA